MPEASVPQRLRALALRQPLFPLVACALVFAGMATPFYGERVDGPLVEAYRDYLFTGPAGSTPGNLAGNGWSGYAPLGAAPPPPTTQVEGVLFMTGLLMMAAAGFAIVAWAGPRRDGATPRRAVVTIAFAIALAGVAYFALAFGPAWAADYGAGLPDGPGTAFAGSALHGSFTYSWGPSFGWFAFLGTVAALAVELWALSPASARPQPDTTGGGA